MTAQTICPVMNEPGRTPMPWRIQTIPVRPSRTASRVRIPRVIRVGYERAPRGDVCRLDSIPATDLLLFSVAFAILHLLPPFLKAPFPLLPLARTEDAFIVLRPFLLIPLYWLLLRRGRGAPLDGRLTISFLLVSVILAYGLGMHDAANSVGHQIRDETSDAYALAYFFDEVASHVLWHVAIMAFSVLIVWTELRYGDRSITARWPSVLGGALYGLTFFLAIIEGATVVIGLPFTVAVIIGLAVAARRAALGRLATFFLVGYVVASLLFVGWGLYWRGFPEPSQLGIP